MSKVFVGGLSYRTTEDTLRSCFAQAGTVQSARIITDRETGRSRGFGFVEMASAAEAEAAIAAWDGKEVDDRVIRVSIANETGPRGGGAPRGGGRGASGPRGHSSSRGPRGGDYGSDY